MRFGIGIRRGSVLQTWNGLGLRGLGLYKGSTQQLACNATFGESHRLHESGALRLPDRKHHNLGFRAEGIECPNRSSVLLLAY